MSYKNIFRLLCFIVKKMDRTEERRLKKKILFRVQKRFIFGFKEVKFKVFGTYLRQMAPELYTK